MASSTKNDKDDQLLSELDDRICDKVAQMRTWRHRTGVGSPWYDRVNQVLVVIAGVGNPGRLGNLAGRSERLRGKGEVQADPLQEEERQKGMRKEMRKHGWTFHEGQSKLHMRPTRL